VYTPYLVQGIETGEADENNDGFISVNELHQYVQRKVQEGKHEMKPQIQAVIKEGFNIVLTKAPIHNREDIYKGIVKSWIGDNGQISDTGRVALIEQQNRLEIEPDKATAIEEEVLKPHKDYLRRLDLYEREYRRIIQENYPISKTNHDELKRLQQELRLKNEDVDKIKNRKISPIPPLKKIILYLPKINLLQYVVVGMIGIMIGYVFRQPLIANSCDKETYSLNDRISLGEEILLTQDKNPDKEAGVKAFLDGHCKTAIEKFESYRKAKPTDPEALIYLNNAKARENGNRLKIAVSVPIGTNPNVAKEMLRGVAQAQDEVNNNSRINGKALEVAIANDDNKPSEAVQIATQFVKDTSILAVVGHNASNASIAAAPVYQQGGLVMISPTSYSPNLSNIGNYIFRTAPSVGSIADSVSRYAIQKARKTNFMICVDYQAIDNVAFMNEFVNNINAAGGKVNSTYCDISAPNFNPNVIISQAINNGANGLVLGLYIDKIKQGLAVARANQGRLSVFSSSTLFTDETLNEGKPVNGMVIAVPWNNKAIPGNPFAQNAQNFWGATVNWRTATSYDATLAIIEGLKVSNTRYELQNKLHDSGFSVNGATGKIQFSKSGDRINNNIFLIKVQQNSTTKKYEFVPIKP
ncbi:MAG: amino acid ABC transporter substrate-binding protein, partial [Dolichospermum sp.]|nr:amino acid ABC transporter substrate-binding protein [Dolichospermum sp.]